MNRTERFYAPVWADAQLNQQAGWPSFETAAFGLVFPPDGTSNHSTKLAKTASKVAGYTRG